VGREGVEEKFKLAARKLISVTGRPNGQNEETGILLALLLLVISAKCWPFLFSFLLNGKQSRALDWTGEEKEELAAQLAQDWLEKVGEKVVWGRHWKQLRRNERQSSSQFPLLSIQFP